MESQKKKLEEQLKSLSDESRKDDLITFEELGVDSIMVDEMCIRDRDVEETDADGNVTTVTKSVLYVNVTLKSYRDMMLSLIHI